MSEYTGVMKTSSSLIVKFVIMLEKGEEEEKRRLSDEPWFSAKPLSIW